MPLRRVFKMTILAELVVEMAKVLFTLYAVGIVCIAVLLGLKLWIDKSKVTSLKRRDNEKESRS